MWSHRQDGPGPLKPRLSQGGLSCPPHAATSGPGRWAVLSQGRGKDRRGLTESPEMPGLLALPLQGACNLHSILCFSISCTSAMDSRRSSVNFFRS